MDHYRCRACGNRTRFDVVATRKTKAFVHFDLGGKGAIEEEEVLEYDVESITCRWCGSSSAIEIAQDNAAIADAQDASSTTVPAPH